MSITIITIPAETTDTVATSQSSGNLDALQEAVGGYIEAVGVGNIAIYLDEEGKLKSRPINERATRLAHRLKVISAHDIIVGDAVVTGFNEHTGENTDAPAAALNYLKGTSN